MLKRMLFCCFFMISTFNAFANVEPGKSYEIALDKWSHILDSYVDDQGRTDFISLSKKSDDLQSVVDFIAMTSPASDPHAFSTKEDVLAYHINAYNALAMHGVIERGIPKGFHSFAKRASFFKFRKIVIGNKKTSLFDYENKVIRSWREPRIHFALNCMVRDCPRLPQKPFLAETLDQQLEAVTKEFFSKPRHVYVDAQKKEVFFSWIMKYYIKDFVSSGKKRDLITYANNYLDTPVPGDYKVRFIKYDWTVNQQPG